MGGVDGDVFEHPSPLAWKGSTGLLGPGLPTQVIGLLLTTPQACPCPKAVESNCRLPCSCLRNINPGLISDTISETISDTCLTYAHAHSSQFGHAIFPFIANFVTAYLPLTMLSVAN